jgi:DNA-binding transcriptional ArsR family regulator
MSRPINGDDVFRAVANPARRRILEMLRQSERGMGDIAATFRLSLPSVSNHLRVLRDAGLVSQRRVGNRRMYHLRAGKLRLVSGWLTRISPQPNAARRRSA